MNKLNMLTTILLILTLCTTAAMAAPSINVGTDISGNAKQKLTFTDTINVANNGDQNLTIVVSVSDLEHTDTSDSIASSRINIDDNSFDLKVTENKDVEFSITIPDNQEVGEYTGTITFEYDNGSVKNTQTASITLNVEVGNHLVIKRVELDVQGDNQRMSDEEKFDEDVKPRSEMTLEITVENDYSEKIDIEDIEVIIRGEGDLDWDDDDSISDLGKGDDDMITFSYEVPESADIEDGTYDIEIEVTGTDEEGNTHGETWTIQVDIDREKYDLLFQSIDLNPSYLDCGETNMRITLDIENVGSRDVDEGTVVLKSNAFKNDVIIRNMEVDEEDDITKTVTLPIKNDLKAGEYFIELELYSTSNSDDNTDVASETINVLACPEDLKTEDEPKEEETTIEVITPTPTEPSTSTSGKVVASTSGSSNKGFLTSGDNTYMIMLIVIIVLLVVLIGVAIAALTKK